MMTKFTNTKLHSNGTKSGARSIEVPPPLDLVVEVHEHHPQAALPDHRPRRAVPPAWMGWDGRGDGGGVSHDAVRTAHAAPTYGEVFFLSF